MDHGQILAKLIDLMRNIFDDDDLTASNDTTAEDVPDWDSINHIRLIVAVEETFKIKFKEAEITAPQTVGELIDFISAKLHGEFGA